MPIVVENNRRQFQYQIFKAGELAGYVQYSMDGPHMWVLHTSMKRSFKSPVLADVLIHHVLTDAHTSRLAVLPFCPAVRTFIADHAEFTALVPADWHDRIPTPTHQKADVEVSIPLDFVRMTGSRRAKHQETTADSPDVVEYVRQETATIPVVREHVAMMAAASTDAAKDPAPAEQPAPVAEPAKG